MTTKNEPSAPQNPVGDVNRVETEWRQNAIKYLRMIVAYMERVEQEARAQTAPGRDAATSQLPPLNLPLPATVQPAPPSKKLDKNGIDYVPTCEDCSHCLSTRNYCLKHKWSMKPHSTSEGCESFEHTDEDTQGNLTERGAEE